MTTVIPQIPADCQLVGEFHDTSDPAFLTQDMVEVFCPKTNTLIRAGWFPDEDPSGTYYVAVYRDCERIRKTYKSAHLTEINSLVERLAIAFCRNPSSSNSLVMQAWPETPTGDRVNITSNAIPMVRQYA
jgi:hypothetical protein